MAQDNRKRSAQAVSAVSAITHVGINIAACILIGVFTGRFLDRIFGVSPGFLVLFSLLGVAAAFRAIFDAHIARPQHMSGESPDGETQGGP